MPTMASALKKGGGRRQRRLETSYERPNVVSGRVEQKASGKEGTEAKAGKNYDVKKPLSTSTSLRND